jgi:threonine dehydratase
MVVCGVGGGGLASGLGLWAATRSDVRIVGVESAASTALSASIQAEDEISSAIRYLALERGVVAERAGAVSVAAVLAGRVSDTAKTVAVVSGRNISPAKLGGILASGCRRP